jgi:hypothetical protein
MTLRKLDLFMISDNVIVSVNSTNLTLSATAESARLIVSEKYFSEVAMNPSVKAIVSDNTLTAVFTTSSDRVIESDSDTNVTLSELKESANEMVSVKTLIGIFTTLSARLIVSDTPLDSVLLSVSDRAIESETLFVSDFNVLSVSDKLNVSENTLIGVFFIESDNTNVSFMSIEDPAGAMLRVRKLCVREAAEVSSIVTLPAGFLAELLSKALNEILTVELLVPARRVVAVPAAGSLATLASNIPPQITQQSFATVASVDVAVVPVTWPV